MGLELEEDSLPSQQDAMEAIRLLTRAQEMLVGFFQEHKTSEKERCIKRMHSYLESVVELTDGES